MIWTIHNAYLAARKELGLSQSDFADRIKVSPGHLSLVESGRKQPSEMMVELTIRVFSLNREWVATGKGAIFDQAEKVPMSMEAKILLGSIALAFFLPTASVGLAIGVGASEVVKKMCAAYKVPNATELARKFFKINRATITSWEKHNNIPTKYLEKTANDTGIPVSHLTANNQTMSRVTEHLLSSIEEILRESDCAKSFDRGEIQTILHQKVSEKIGKDPDLRDVFL